MEVLLTNNFQPDIIVGGLRIGEPMIALTGLLSMLVCFYSFVRLGPASELNQPLRFSRIFFLLMGISTTIGAFVGHCFLYCLPFVFKAPGWVMGMVAVSALVQASIYRAQTHIRAGWSRGFSWLNLLALTAALWFVTTTLWFPWVEIHSSFGFLLIMVPLEVWLYLKTNQTGSRRMLQGVLFLAAGAVVHILKCSFGVWFCYFDIAHLLMCGAFWFFMLGAEADLPAPIFVSNS